MKKSLKKITENSKIVIEKIKNELNIYIEQYRNIEIFGKITQIFFIQKYAIGNIFKPVLFSLILYFIGFFILNLTTIQYFIYGIFSLILFISLGLFIGIILLIRNLKKDLLTITQQSTELVEKIYVDICNTNTNNFEKLKNPLTLIFEGILIGLVQPKISSSVTNIPLVGNIVDNGIDKTIPILIENFKKQEDKFNISEKAENIGNQILNKIEKSKIIINAYLSKIENTISKSISFISFPIYTITIILFIVLLIFILAIN